MPSHAPLSLLPLSMIVRSLFTTTVSSSPVLLRPSLRVMSVLAHSSNAFFNPDRNPVLRWFLKKTFYAQFCAGERPEEVRQTIRRLKDIGFTGVILGYAKEVVLSETQARGLASCGGDGPEAAADCIKNEIVPWAEATETTVKLAQPGDFVALKFTGAGRQALYSLSERLPPPPALAEAIDRVCACAAEHGVRLLFDAEQAALQPGIDDWTLDYMRRYNTEPGRAVIYGTYQAYLKSTPATLARHLVAARDGGFTLGVKLVRGAYLGSDPRHLIHDTKADTDAAYDAIAASMLRRQWGDVFRSRSRSRKQEIGNAGEGEGAGAGAEGPPFPEASLVVASHNAESVRRARAICEAGEAKIDVAFGQLQGMADEISCELVSAKKGTTTAAAARQGGKTLQTYKYLVWGSTGECMKYLLRRAYENRDAVQRTRAGRDAMWGELVRRAKQTVGLTS
ncbi:proline dehydrogenase [Sodiomyces alkalinus F11]|uniref:Proline dehydrogenase n=1 Tax=Sodiomyces alkalinus (strain CBS 110278 / VKM F-3762 / F11) TaxID=1314773 RepID=A0A3N2PZ05_SODAK|nr:proline dehydrogenase [Sodiomyces alkalinus F11]ROT39656.1 proline dehydrogenase [Sodiomyces alkalinus F11]